MFYNFYLFFYLFILFCFLRLMMRHRLLVWSTFWHQPVVDCVLLTQSIILNHLSLLCSIHQTATHQALRLVVPPWKWWTTLLALLLYVTANPMLSQHLSVRMFLLILKINNTKERKRIYPHLHSRLAGGHLDLFRFLNFHFWF